MARVAATVEDLRRGDLPPVCVKTGDAASGKATLEFTSSPGWTWILLLFGIFPFLIARYFSRVHVTCRVPVSERAMRRADVYRRIYRGGLLLAGVAVVAGVAARLSSIGMAGFAILLATLVFMAVGWPVVWPTGRVAGDWVFLSFVDERFAAEVDRRYGRSP